MADAWLGSVFEGFVYFAVDFVFSMPLNNVNSIHTASERAHLGLTEAFEPKDRI